MIVVRFAPSPTGYMHIGNLRTALLNYLFALSTQKKTQEEICFVLRMDDTDMERSRKEYEEAVYEDLKWMGIKWDRLEHQSKRLSRYQEVLEDFKQRGLVYACYETAEELEYKRNRQRARGLPPVYDRSGLNLTQEEKAKFEAEGRTPHYRFKLEHKETSWNDIVRGECAYNGAHLSDPIVVRGDGTFPYMLPSAIDDMDMGITHVIRGEDHVTNTAVQIQMFEALGANIPVFGHPPLLTGAEGKLSKRMGSLSSRELKEAGIEPMTIASLLARLGTPETIIPCKNWKELADLFDLSAFGRAQPHFDAKDLFKLNPKVVRLKPLADVNAELKALGSKEISLDFWEAICLNIEKIADIPEWEEICFSEETYPLSQEERAFCQEAAKSLPTGDFDETTFSVWTSKVKDETGKKGKDLFHPLRMALTGKEAGPELKRLLPLLGYEKTLKRLQG